MKYPIVQEVFNQHLVILGKTGAGKSYALRGMIEMLLHQKKRVCIVDPKGDHWGIGASANGKAAGFPVVTFGNHKVELKDNIPISAHTGKEVAELVASGNRPCVIGFHGWMPGDRTRFFIDFASTLFNKNDAPLWLFVDEVHNFAPQGKTLDPQSALSLHWMNRLASESRGIGITILMASQRPQKVHKDTLTCAETLVAMRVIHKRDRDAYKDWIDGCGDPERGKMVMNSLAEMKKGEAYVWSPEIPFFERLKFPLIETFDSFKAPTGEGRSNAPQGWAEVNLDEVRKKLATTIEEAKANDPKELKKRIRELENEKRQHKPVIDEKYVSRTVEQTKKQLVREMAGQVKQYKLLLENTMKFIIEITTKNFDSSLPKEEIEKAIKETIQKANKMIETRLLQREGEFERFKKNANKLMGQIQRTLESDISVSLEVKHNEPYDISTMSPKERPVRIGRPITTNVESGLTNPEQRIVDAIGWMDSIGIDTPDQVAVAYLSDYTYNGGAFNNTKGALRSKGYVEYVGDNIRLTEAGRRLINIPSETLTTEELHKKIMARLSNPEQRILSPLLKTYPEAMPDVQLAEASGYKSGTGAFNNAKGRLRTLGLIEYPAPKSARARDILFID